MTTFHVFGLAPAVKTERCNCFCYFLVTEEDKSSTQVIQKKQKARFIRHAFYYWAKMTRKSQEAKRLYMERLLPK